MRNAPQHAPCVSNTHTHAHMEVKFNTHTHTSTSTRTHTNEAQILNHNSKNRIDVYVGESRAPQVSDTHTHTERTYKVHI